MRRSTTRCSAKVLTFTLFGVGADGFVDYEEAAGALIVDVGRGQAEWRPA